MVRPSFSVSSGRSMVNGSMVRIPRGSPTFFFCSSLTAALSRLLIRLVTALSRLTARLVGRCAFAPYSRLVVGSCDFFASLSGTQKARPPTLSSKSCCPATSRSRGQAHRMTSLHPATQGTRQKPKPLPFLRPSRQKTFPSQAPLKDIVGWAYAKFGSRFPCMKFLLATWLVTMESQAPVETAFSKLNRIITSHRHALGQDKLEQIMTILINGPSSQPEGQQRCRARPS
eukprot:m.217408 g.217408  ORF g.217408 m.217408 type:complete len:229 (+) comp15559_c0_seq2:798-1484(+)